MEETTQPFRFTAPAIAFALIATVVTQILYISLGVSGTPAALMLWRAEALAFIAIAILGFAWAQTAPLVAGGLVIGAIANIGQTGMGLTMFGPVGDAGEALGPVMQAILGMAFFLYFAGKIAFAVAAIAIGAQSYGCASGWPRIAGFLAIFAGVIALLANVWAIFAAREATYVAGATGTVAVFVLAVALGALRQPLRPAT